ncbi:MAG: hypothetical protein IJ275_05000 [Ruminococcus sp.]|nr:hypothetical protein [Ruminococcus sp.]
MNNINFDSLTNIKAPEAWIENALNIPSTVEKKKPLLFFKHSRAIAAVACLVLVSVVSITIYLKHDRLVVPIDPNYTETLASVCNDATDATSDKNETSSNQENTVVLETQPYELIEPTEGGSPNSQKPTQKPIVGPTLPNDPPENTEPSQPQFEVPTEAASHPKPPTPTVAPTVVPQDPTNTQPPIDPPPCIEPSDPSWEVPTVSPTEAPPSPSEPEFGSISFSAQIRTSLVSGDNLVYCSVYDSNNHLIGDSNLYSAQHKAYIIGYSDGKAILSYRLPDGLITEHGTYSYYFYNRYGETLYYNTKTI